MNSRALLVRCLIFFLLTVSLEPLIQFRDDIFNSRIDILICKDIFCGIHNQDVHSGCAFNSVLESSPAFADTALQEVSLDCSLEKFFRYGYEQPVMGQTIVRNEDVA